MYRRDDHRGPRLALALPPPVLARWQPLDPGTRLQRRPNTAPLPPDAAERLQLALGAAVLWDETLDRDVGDRIHRLIGELLTTGAGLDEVTPAARRLQKAWPVRGARVPGVRMRVASAAGTYLRRCRPDADLLGVELPVGAGVSDLVWEHEGLVVIDELKSGVCDLGDPLLVAHVTRFLDGGHGDRSSRGV